jgi:hypothetical protein
VPAPAAARVVALQRSAGNRAVAALLAAPREGVMRGGTTSPAPAFEGPPINTPKLPAGDVITACIEVFAASASSQTAEGKRILAKLRELHAAKEIAFEDFSGQPEHLKGVHGMAREGSKAAEGSDIALNDDYAGDVVDTLTTLVHEAVHHLYDEGTLDEEMRTRNAEIDFYTELQAGVTVGGVLCQVPAGWDSAIETQRDKRTLDQLIDYIVGIEWRSRWGFDAAWVAAHIDDWGGIPNRWPFTKSQYVIRLIESPGAHPDLLFRLLESEAGNAKSFGDIVYWVGEEKLQEGLAVFLRNPDHRERIEELQEKTGAELIAWRP